ncbi:hypothetical protein L7F22_019814 [Adiantum nelumboides]|nr:hypothetical protein [Adiantum nelumboides]
MQNTSQDHSADQDGDILMMNSTYDSSSRDHTNDSDIPCSSSMAIKMGMSSRGSADSLASTASSSSLNQEPELSQSFGSTRSYDLMTPIKPLQNLHPSNQSIKRFSIAASLDAATTAAIQAKLHQSPHISPRTLSDTPLRRDENQVTSTTSPSQESQKKSSLGLHLNHASDVVRVEPRKNPPPGLAGRLKINLPSNKLQSDGPITPGGHAAIGARDGAANGGFPMSPFEPPTPLLLPQDQQSMMMTMSPINTTPTQRPILAHRHSSGRPTPLIMSPLTKELSSLGMRKTMSSNSKGSESGSISSSQRSVASEASSATSASTLLTPPFSPFTQAKTISTESDVSSLNVGIPTTPFDPSQRSISGGSASSAVSTTAVASPSSGNAKAPRTVSPRPKVSKAVKSAPYPSPSREDNKASSVFMSITQSQPSSSYFEAPQKSNATPTTATTSPLAPSILRDVVKPPGLSGKQLTTPSSAKMEKCLSEPVPRTVSARHLANRTLHPVFARNYALGDELGSGGFGFVVGATRISDGLPVAVKFIWKEKVPSHGWVRDDKFGAIPMEAFVLKVIDSPFVVKFVDLFADGEFFYLIMEHHGSPWKAPQSGEDEKMDETPVLENKQEDKTLKAIKPSNSKAQHLSPINTKATLPADNGPAPSPTFAVFPPGSDVPLKSEEVLSSSPTAMSPSSDSDVSELSAYSSTSSLRPAPMERRSSCDLFECIEQHSSLSEDKARWVFAQIVEAVYDLDKRGICHRDIKDENCVVDRDFNVKLIDFGSAVITDPRKPMPYFNRFFGTMTFASSEILQGKQYRAPHAEIWSLGVLLSILLSGECPFADPQAAIRGKISKPSKPYSKEAMDLLIGCLQVDPDRRATIREVRQHPWVRKAWEQRSNRRAFTH